MNLSYEMNDEDYKELARFRLWQHWYGIVLLIAQTIGGTLLVVGIAGIALMRGWVWAIVASAALPFLLLPRWFLLHNCSRHDEQSANVELKIDENGVTTGLGSGKQFLWQDFSHFSLSSKHYVLHLVSGVVLIPKRILAPQQFALLDDLLRQKLLSYRPKI